MAQKPKKAPAGGGKGGSRSWILAAVAVALVVIVVFAVRQRRAARMQAVAATTPAAPVSPATMKDLDSIPADVWNRAATSGAAAPTFVGDSDFVGGKPVVLYIGAGYCPYCAAARWSMIAALERFGTFTGLTLGASSSIDVYPSTPTFSFYGSKYTSPYLELQTVELAGDEIMANGRYEPLERPTPTQELLLEKYDAPPYVDQAGAGGIPFILVGGRYMWSGSPFSPGVLADRTQAEIAATLPQGAGAAAQAILANANQLTAAICAVDGGQPADVCSQPAVHQAIAALPHKGP